MTLHGHGFLPLALPAVAPLTGEVYSGFGFRSTQDNGLLYYRASLVSRLGPAAGTVVDMVSWREESEHTASWLTWPLSAGRAVPGVPAAGPRDASVSENRDENARSLC